MIDPTVLSIIQIHIERILRNFRSHWTLRLVRLAAKLPVGFLLVFFVLLCCDKATRTYERRGGLARIHVSDQNYHKRYCEASEISILLSRIPDYSSSEPIRITHKENCEYENVLSVH